MLDTKKESVLSVNLVYSDDEMSGFDYSMSESNLKRECSKSRTPQRSSDIKYSQSEIKSRRTTVGVSNGSIDLEKSEEFSTKENLNLRNLQNKKGRSVGEIQKGTPKKYTRNTLGYENSNVSFDLETEKHRIEMDEAFKSFDGKPNLRSTRGRSLNGTLYNDVDISRRTMGNETLYLSFNLEVEKEKLEMEKAFDNFEYKPRSKSVGSKSVYGTPVKRTTVKSRKTMGSEPINVSFNIENERNRIELEKAFEHFPKEPIFEARRGRSFRISVSKRLSEQRKTMGVIPTDVSFDFVKKKKRVQIEKDFEHFEDKPIYRDTRSKSIARCTVNNSFTKSRKTLGAVVKENFKGIPSTGRKGKSFGVFIPEHQSTSKKETSVEVIDIDKFSPTKENVIPEDSELSEIFISAKKVGRQTRRVNQILDAYYNEIDSNQSPQIVISTPKNSKATTSQSNKSNKEQVVKTSKNTRAKKEKSQNKEIVNENLKDREEKDKEQQISSEINLEQKSSEQGADGLKLRRGRRLRTNNSTSSNITPKQENINNDSIASVKRSQRGRQKIDQDNITIEDAKISSMHSRRRRKVVHEPKIVDQKCEIPETNIRIEIQEGNEQSTVKESRNSEFNEVFDDTSSRTTNLRRSRRNKNTNLEKEEVEKPLPRGRRKKVENIENTDIVSEQEFLQKKLQEDEESKGSKTLPVKSEVSNLTRETRRGRRKLVEKIVSKSDISDLETLTPEIKETRKGKRKAVDKDVLKTAKSLDNISEIKAVLKIRGNRNGKAEKIIDIKESKIKEAVTPNDSQIKESDDVPRKRRNVKNSNKENKNQIDEAVKEATEIEQKPETPPIGTRRRRKSDHFLEINADGLTRIKSAEEIFIVSRPKRVLRSNSSHISKSSFIEAPNISSRKGAGRKNKPTKDTPTSKRGRLRLNSAKDEIQTDAEQLKIGGYGNGKFRQ